MKNEPGPPKDLTFEIRHFIARAILNNQQIATRAGLNLTDMQCLNILELLGPLKPGQLAELTGLTTGGTTVALDRLEAAKYIRRQPNPEDRRSVFVQVVPARMRKLHGLYKGVQRLMGGLFAEFSEDELSTVLKFFVRVNAIRPISGRPDAYRSNTPSSSSPQS